MSSAPAKLPLMASIGDQGVLNKALSGPLSEIWIDRDLGWLDFNDRVLAEALDERTPLLKRAKFLAIFTSNLDEFFMKRVAILRGSESPDRKTLLARLREPIPPTLCRRVRAQNRVTVANIAL
jgi:polyphosphate kinase